MAIALSLLALLATFYELYLQRKHNEKSLKPLLQVDLGDLEPRIYVHVKNNGIGPFILERVAFTKNGECYSNIEECLSLDPKSYMHLPRGDRIEKVILPGSYLEVFDTTYDGSEPIDSMDLVKRELSYLKLKVHGRDIYDNKISMEKDFNWFSRHEAKVEIV